MADNIEVNDRSSAAKTVAMDDVSGVLHQVVKIGVGGDGQAAFLAGGAGATDSGTARVRLADDDPASAGGTTITAAIPRPANTTAYTAADAWANATSAAVAVALPNASRGSDKSGIITDIFLHQAVRPGTLLTGELWIFDSQLATALNDNVAWALTSADLAKVVDVVEFAMISTGSSVSNSYCRLPGLNIGFTTVGQSSLFVVPKVTNAYLPSSGEVLNIKAKILRSN